MNKLPLISSLKLVTKENIDGKKISLNNLFFEAMTAFPKLLVIPSWYPSPEDALRGCFFREQALLAIQDFDTRVWVMRKQPDTPAYSGTTRFKGLRRFWEKSMNLQPCEKMQQSNFKGLTEIVSFSNAWGFTRGRKLKARLAAHVQRIEAMGRAGWLPDLVHAQSVDLGGLLAHELKKKFGIPYVITEHMPFALQNFPPHLRQSVREAFENADMVLSVSSDKVRQLGLSEIACDLNLTYNLVDEIFFPEVCKSYAPGGLLRLVTIGAASFLKDYPTLLRSLQLIKQMGIEFRLTIIGWEAWGDQGEEIKALVQQLGLSEHTQLIGKVSRAEVNAKLVENQIYLQTSIAEGLPVSVLEAMASGLYVVATRHGGTEDIIQSAEVGQVVAVKDIHAIAQTLNRLHRGEIHHNPALSRQTVLGICGRKAFSQRLFGYYWQVLAQTPTSPTLKA